MQKQITDMTDRLAAFQEKTLAALQGSPSQHLDHLGPVSSNPLSSQTVLPQSLAPMYAEPMQQTMAPMRAAIYTHPNAQVSIPTQTLQPRQVPQTQAYPSQQLPAQTQNYNNRYGNRSRGRGRGRGYNSGYQNNQDNYDPTLDSGDFQRISANYHNAHPQNQSHYQTPYNYQPNYQHPPPSHFVNQAYQQPNTGYQNQPQGNQNQGWQNRNRQGNSGHNWPQRSQSPGGGSYVREPYQPQNQNQYQQNQNQQQQQQTQNNQQHRPPTPHSSPSNNRGGNY
jgi:hypothetical protein